MFSSANPQAVLAALPGYRHLGVLSRRQTPGASLKRLERSRSCRHLCVSYPFYERTGPRHATYSSLFASKPLRPLNLNYTYYLGFRKPPGEPGGSGLLPQLPGGPHQAVNRSAGEGGDIFGGEIPGDGFIE